MVNPNGRVPGTYEMSISSSSYISKSNLRSLAIIDPNTNITLFDSGAIVAYLVTIYDKTHSITYTTSPKTFILQ